MQARAAWQEAKPFGLPHLTRLYGQPYFTYDHHREVAYYDGITITAEMLADRMTYDVETNNNLLREDQRETPHGVVQWGTQGA